MVYKPLSWSDVLQSVKYNQNIVINDKMIGAKVLYDKLFNEDIVKLESEIEEGISKITEANFNKEHFKIETFKYYK